MLLTCKNSKFIIGYFRFRGILQLSDTISNMAMVMEKTQEQGHDSFMGQQIGQGQG